MLGDLKKSLLRGNVIDLAVAVIIGIAFGAVVTSLVNDVIMAFVGAVFGKSNFDELTVTVGDGVVAYGRFLTAVVNFVIIGTVLFLVVRAAERLFGTQDDEPTAEVRLLTEIRDELRQRG
ncbi:MAG: large conductance mechanosensitive channel protein MscL [Actinobacteria bacterium]|nr:large conductance mechanosensitive channel protein MscL [Actinomycetota bacterium]